MKASEITESVQKIESLMLKDIGDIITNHLRNLTTTTGLDIDSVSINLIETTTFTSPEREWVVSGIRIDVSLPRKIGY